MTGALAERFRLCRTPTDVYRQIIPLERTATPSELAELWNSRDALPAEARTWMESVWRSMFFEAAELQQFTRARISEYVWLYRGRPAAHAARTLVVAFAGVHQRLFMPIGVLLQHFNDTEIDFVLLLDPLFGFFSEGIPGFGNSVPEIAAKLGGEIGSKAYGQVIGFGVSAGGSAALLTGALLGAGRAVSVSGRVPTPDAKNGASLMEDLARADRSRTSMVCAFGAQNARDRKEGIALARASGASVVPVEGVDEHNVFVPLLKAKKLRAFLNETVLGEEAT